MPADPTATINGYALKGKPSMLIHHKFEPWSYNPRYLGEDDVEVAITHCGICGSDLHTAFGGWGDVTYPIIVGHEIIGHITAKGKNVTKFNIGDRVGCGAMCGCCHACDNCKSGNENHCRAAIGTYNGKYPDGEHSQGGYASSKRFDQYFCFHIPENITSAEAAPLLCAGATTYSPLARYKVGPGKKVGVIGIGGLGHLAVQFAAKMGAEVVAISSSASKREAAARLGASDYINMQDEAAQKRHAGSFDVIISCANPPKMEYDAYLKLCKLDAYFVLVALPEDVISFKPFTLTGTRVHVVGSSIGNHQEIEAMLQFCSKNNVRPWIELLPMSQVNEGIRKVKENDVKFRVVLEQGK